MPNELKEVVERARAEFLGREMSAVPEGIGAYLKRVPASVKEEYGQGLEAAGQPRSPLDVPYGILQAVTSPITGTVRALVGEPVTRMAEDVGINPAAAKTLGTAAALAVPIKVPKIGAVGMARVEAIPVAPAGTSFGMLGTGPAMTTALGDIVRSVRQNKAALIGGATGALGGYVSAEPEASIGEKVVRSAIGGGIGAAGGSLVKRAAQRPSVPGTAAPTRVTPEVPTIIPGVSPARPAPLPVNPDALSIPGETGLAYHRALNPELFRRAGVAGVDFFKQNPTAYDRALSVTENIGRNIGKGKIDAGWLKGYGLEDREARFVIDAYESMRQSAQSMAHMAKVSRDLNLSNEAREVLRTAGVETEDRLHVPWWKRVDNITRGAIVSQLGTAVRNAETVVARLGMDTMTSALDNGIARLAGRTPTTGALDGMETFLNTIGAIRPSKFKSQKAMTEQVMRAFPSETKRLLSTYNSDIAVSGAGQGAGLGERILRGGEEFVHMANIWNRGQEFLIRRAVFTSKLSQETERLTGLRLEDVIKSGQAWRIPEGAIRTSVDRALEVTFAAQPKFGTMSRAFTDFINKTQPISTLGIPFPRFLTQSWKFTAEHSPFGFLRYLSKGERTKFAAGDVSGVSKAIIGSGLLGAAIAMRLSPNADPVWYKYRTDSGKTVDLRPFAPFSTYLFMAELLSRRHANMTTKDIMDGLLGVNLRAGTGLVLMDNVIEGLANTAKRGDVAALLKQIAGEYAGRLTVPFAQLRDIYDEFVDGFSVAREKSPEGREFIGPTLANLPMASRTLPVVRSPVQAEPYVTEHPLLKQVTGIRVSPTANKGATELSRLGFRDVSILPKTGIASVDRKYTSALGPLVEKRLTALTESPLYQRASDAKKGVILQKAMTGLRRSMKASVKLTEEEKSKLRIGRLSGRVRELLLETGRISP